ncbi:hypothetical protein Q5O14_10365 [Eubacteriaceae bacterium ES2]|nr:hypothetical protein Q5O14_10365 [Eubacteriaceae bacterium ES2]
MGKSRTFFIFDEDSNDFEILAYFTIALQVLKIPEDLISGNQVKKLDGLSSKFRGNRITEFPAILIGQLGKNELYPNKITGSEILDYCLSKILEGQFSLGGRIIMLECKNITSLVELYENYGFRILEKDYQQDELLQMLKILEADLLIES